MRGIKPVFLAGVLALTIAVPVTSHGALPAVFNHVGQFHASSYGNSDAIGALYPVRCPSQGCGSLDQAAVILNQTSPSTLIRACTWKTATGVAIAFHPDLQYSVANVKGVYTNKRFIVAGRFASGPWRGRLITLYVPGDSCVLGTVPYTGKVVTV